jgi:hypothetical protein
MVCWFYTYNMYHKILDVATRGGKWIVWLSPVPKPDLSRKVAVGGEYKRYFTSRVPMLHMVAVPERFQLKFTNPRPGLTFTINLSQHIWGIDLICAFHLTKWENIWVYLSHWLPLICQNVLVNRFSIYLLVRLCIFFWVSNSIKLIQYIPRVRPP